MIKSSQVALLFWAMLFIHAQTKTKGRATPHIQIKMRDSLTGSSYRCYIQLLLYVDKALLQSLINPEIFR